MQYMQWLINNWNYWWGNTQTTQIAHLNPQQLQKANRIQQMKQMLSSCIYQKSLQQRICLYYYEILNQYSNFQPTYIAPIFIQNFQKNTISIKGQLKINTGNIKCQIKTVIIFSINFIQQMPLFFIQNPDYKKIKPNINLVDFNSKYSTCSGGLLIKVNNSKEHKWNWDQYNYYKSTNIVRILKWIQMDLLVNQFPYIKRKNYNQKQENQKLDKCVKTIEKMLQFIKEQNESESNQQNQYESHLLSSIQQLDILSHSIQCQQLSIKQENKSLQQKIKEFEDTNLDISNFYPTVVDNQSKQMLQLLSSYEAYCDTSLKLENIFEDKKCTLTQALTLLNEIETNKFYLKYSIIKKMKCVQIDNSQ